MYFMIGVDDGDPWIAGYDTKEDLLAKMEPDGYAYVELAGSNALASIPSDGMMYWHGKFLIIKGEIVQPRPKKVITRYDID